MTGSVRLLSLAVGWISGAHGPGGSVAARIGLALFAVAAVARTIADHAAPAWAAVTAAWIVAALLADSGRLGRRPQTASSKTGDAKTGSGKADDGKTAAAAVEKTPTRPRRGLFGLLRRTSAPADDSSGEKPLEQPPAPPSWEDVSRALHDLVGPGRGVLLTALRDRLRLPDTKAVREVLAQHSIPTRPGVRTQAGNGPGVHRDDFPAPPPSPAAPPVGDVVAGQRTNNNEPTPEPWSARELQQGFRIVPDPEYGPAASRVEYLHKKT
ncbi:hypothetical protein [Streptomyces pseudogriseolus]|nr:hypothetical protein [Streptomyces gancidicus]